MYFPYGTEYTTAQPSALGLVTAQLLTLILANFQF